MSGRKIGAGHAGAMLRLGLKELRNAANPSRESVADSEIGLYGTSTQGEIADARGGPGSGPDQESRKTPSLEAAGVAQEPKSYSQNAIDVPLTLNELRGYAKTNEVNQQADKQHDSGKETSMTLAELRGYADSKAAEASHSMEHGRDYERGEIEM
ncbi:hypothetical protein BH10PLA2_BH10PLA2_20490 [soil metagenome]